MIRSLRIAGCILLLAWSAALPARAAEPITVYAVRQGDTLYDLASAYFVHLEDYRLVQRRNRIANPKRMLIATHLSVPTRLLRTAPVDGRLGAFRGAVTISANGRPIPLANGMPMREGFVVETGASAFARVDLPDGSRLSVPSQSRVRIERLRRVLMTNAVERVFVVEAGRGESTVTPLRNPQDSYIVRTPMSVSAVRGTEFHVHYEADQHVAATEVLAGIVMVSANGGAPASVPAGFGASSDAPDRAAPAALLPPPALIEADKPFDGASVAIDIAPSAQAQAYRVRLAADAGFIDMLDETTTTVPKATFSGLGDGVYFVRISAIDSDGLEGMPATYAIDRALNTLSLFTPVVSLIGRTQRYLFRWEVSGDGDRSYRFQLYKDRDPRPVIDQPGLAEPQITVTDLKPGQYVWRVMSRTIGPDRRIDKWSPAEPFHIGE